VGSNTTVFLRNYQILEEAAALLRSAEITDIDALLRTVERATKAHRRCRARLAAVEQLLGQDDDL
jgi:exonuclease VII small subunit